MKPNETNQHKPPNQAVIEASRYAAEIFPDPTQQGTAVQFFLSQPWTATRNDVETFQRVRSTIDQWVSLPAHERIRWSWLTPKTPVPVCLCGSQCEVVDGTCVRCRYEKCLATRINDRIYDIYYEKDAAGRFVNQRFVWDAVHRYARVDGRPLADDILDDLYNKCWQQVTAALPRYKEQKDAKQSTWLYQICRFTVLKYLRDEGRRVKRELKHGLKTVPLNETAAPLHHTRAPIGMDSAKYAPALSLVDQETAEWLARGTVDYKNKCAARPWK